MICRDIVVDTEKKLQVFDWFNDYDDTKRWCKNNAPELVALLDSGFQNYLKERNAKWKK